MARKQRSEMAAGVFVIVTVLALLVIVLWLGASGLLETTGQEAVFYVPLDINPGLTKGSPVNIGGLVIGRLERVELNREQRRVYYVANITAPEITIHADSAAHVSAGLVGKSSLTVDPGSQDQPLADWDHPVLIVGGMDQIIQNLADASEQIREVLAIDLNREDPEALLGKLHAVVTNIRTITANIAPETSAGTPDTIAARLKSGIGNVDQLAAKTRAGNWGLHNNSTWHRHLSFFGSGPGDMTLTKGGGAPGAKARLGSLVVYKRALTDEEIAKLGGPNR